MLHSKILSSKAAPRSEAPYSMAKLGPSKQNLKAKLIFMPRNSTPMQASTMQNLATPISKRQSFQAVSSPSNMSSSTKRQSSRIPSSAIESNSQVPIFRTGHPSQEPGLFRKPASAAYSSAA